MISKTDVNNILDEEERRGQGRTGKDRRGQERAWLVWITHCWMDYRSRDRENVANIELVRWE